MQACIHARVGVATCACVSVLDIQILDLFRISDFEFRILRGSWLRPSEARPRSDGVIITYPGSIAELSAVEFAVVPRYDTKKSRQALA